MVTGIVEQREQRGLVTQVAPGTVGRRLVVAAVAHLGEALRQGPAAAP
jgi:hypothetical protein